MANGTPENIVFERLSRLDERTLHQTKELQDLKTEIHDFRKDFTAFKEQIGSSVLINKMKISALMAGCSAVGAALGQLIIYLKGVANG